MNDSRTEPAPSLPAAQLRAIAAGLRLVYTGTGYEVWEHPDANTDVRIAVYADLAAAVAVIADRELDQPAGPNPVLVQVLAERFDCTLADLTPAPPINFVYADSADLDTLGITEAVYRAVAVHVAALLAIAPADAAVIVDTIAWTLAAAEAAK